MKYTITCPTCKKTVTISTRGSIKVQDAETKLISLSVDCPLCGAEIGIIPARHYFNTMAGISRKKLVEKTNG